MLVTPANWFDIVREAERRADARARIVPTLEESGGANPFAAVRVDEHLAIHQTFQDWWPALCGEGRPASIGRDDYDRFLSASRTLLREKAVAILSDPSTVPESQLVAFPGLAHPLLRDDRQALTFFRSFLGLMHSPSLVAWARDRVREEGAIGRCAAHPWLRLLLQKIALEDGDVEVSACLRAVYGPSEALRRTLLEAEAALLDQCDMRDLEAWPKALGLQGAERTTSGMPVSAARTPAAGDADITVLMPSFQHEDFIVPAIDSVLSQTHSSLRLLVIDDRSSDRTAALAAGIDDARVQVVVNEENVGLADSLLGALDRVTTPYVAILNSDDLYHPERLERCRALLQASPEVQVVATGLVPIDREGLALTPQNTRRLLDGARVVDWVQWFSALPALEGPDTAFATLLEHNVLATSSNIVCRTSFLRERRDVLAGLKYCLDWHIFLDAASTGALAYVPDALLAYRLHGSNTVWFDESRRRGYVREVNRVLATALARAAHPTGRDGRPNPAAFQAAASRAARHSDADAALMLAAQLLGPSGVDHLPVDDGLAGAAPSDAGADRGLVVAAAARALVAVTGEERRRMQDELSAVRDRAYSSPEWFIGHTLWNRLRLSRLGFPTVRGIRWLLDRRNRWTLSVRRWLVARGWRRPVAVVASGWSFPVHSHTFVYQEMLALDWMGLDTWVFCCARNARSELHAAFDPLWHRTIMLRSEHERRREDRDYYLRTKPERVHALMARLSEATGWSAEALLQEPRVMMGFTFTRHVELSGASYLHTYFFYDQSLMALMAGFLLGVPRGVTAYADHVLHDYPFKCVALHLELADVVVATSRRIKQELNAIGGGRFEDKILVKPNGIDTARFPHVEPADRLAREGPVQLVSVSRIEPKKGLIHLIDAVGLLRSRGIAVQAQIVGGVDPLVPQSADCLRDMEARITALGLGDHVILHGTRTQSAFIPMLARGHIFVAPYVEVASGDKDGIPTSVLEAMACGLPVVTTDSGSIREAVTDGVEGFTVPQRNPGALADAVQRLVEDRDLYAAMSKAARQRAVTEFDARVTEARLHERIRGCLAGRT